MVDQYRAPSNTYLQSTTGGTLSDDAFQDKVVAWARAIEAWKTPLLNKAWSNETFDNPLHQWGTSRRIRRESRLSAGVNNAVTTIPVTTGEGLLFQAQGVIEIYDVDANDNPVESTKETLWIESISADNLTVDTRGTYSTAASHSSNAIVRLVGTAEPENGEHAEAPRQTGFTSFNYKQRFNAKLTADKAFQNTPTWEDPNGNPHLMQFADEVVKQKVLLENTMFTGVRYAGSGDPSNPRPSLMGGINTYLTTNVVNMAGASLTPGDLEAVMAEIQGDLNDPSPARQWVMGFDEAAILDTTINPIRRASASDSSLNTVVNTYRTRFGEISVAGEYNVPAGNIYLLDWNKIKVKPYKGLNWHKSRKDGAQHAVDHDVDAISGDFTVEVTQEFTMARIYNFDLNLANYPSGYEYF